MKDPGAFRHFMAMHVLSFSEHCKRWVRFARLPRTQRWRVVEAAGWLILAALALKVLPFKSVIKQAGGLTARAGEGVVTSVPRRSPDLAGQVGIAVERAARGLPLRLVCLPQAIAAHWMLCRRGIDATLHLGVKLSEDGEAGMSAHAWLTVGDQAVIGALASLGLNELARFSRK